MDGKVIFVIATLREVYSFISIRVGDQIIEVNGQSLVGVTHACATNVLKATSGLVK